MIQTVGAIVNTPIFLSKSRQLVMVLRHCPLLAHGWQFSAGIRVATPNSRQIFQPGICKILHHPPPTPVVVEIRTGGGVDPVPLADFPLVGVLL